MPVVERIDYAPDFQDQLWDIGEPFLAEAGDVVLDAMGRNIPRSTDGSYGRPAGYAASRLSTLRAGRDPAPYRDVGTDAATPDGDSYPAMLEHGTKPHIIESRGPWPLRDRRTGRVFGRRVMHPGTRPIPWARLSAEALRGRVFR